MSYIGLNKDCNIILIDETFKIGDSFAFGELVFSFLEINLTEYNQIYKIISKEDFSYKDLLQLKSKYPITYAEIICENFYPTENDNTKVLQEIALGFLLENKEAFFDLYKHPIFKYSNNMFGTSYQNVIKDINFFYLQEYCKNLLDFCFIKKDFRGSMLSKRERYFLFSAVTPYMENLLHSNKVFFPIPYELKDSLRMELYKAFTEEHSIDEWLNGNFKEILNLLTDDMIQKIHSSNLEVLDLAYCDTPFDILAFELREFFIKDIKVKCCANCGKFFIPTGKYNTDCCDRIPDGQKYSCKKIMVQKRRRERLNTNPIIREYDRAYKRNYARVSNHKMEQSEFQLWVDEASKKRDNFSIKYQTSPSDQIVIDFKKYLGNK